MSLKINLKKMDLRHPSKTLVTFYAKPKDGAKANMAHLDKKLQSLVRTAIDEKTFNGDKKETLTFRSVDLPFAQNVIVLGMGSMEKIDAETLRGLGAVAYAQIKGLKLLVDVAIDLEALIHLAKNPATSVQAFTEGFLLSDYSFDDYKTAKKVDAPVLKEVLFAVGSKTEGVSTKAAVDTAKTLVECIHFSRRLGDQPANKMTPDLLAKAAVAAAKGVPHLKVTVWDKARIKKEGFGGLLGVSLGSDKDPRFIILEYKNGKAKQKPVCFVGKGLTFDSGGISIKPSAQMEEMIYDMCGGANVIGALLAIAKLKLKVNAIGLVPATENMPGPGANKPGDILTIRNGKTVEVFNTDAEGRLILADALSYASEMKPSAIFDAATLTGAILVALSNIHTGVFTRDKKTMTAIQKAADTTGELVWQMPLTSHHLDDVKGSHADLCNISSGKGAGSSTAAAFLGEFVDSDIPWAHFDIAGTAWNTANRLNYVPKKGATGVMIRTFVELAKVFG